jgi:hypothetical protein
MEGLSNNGQSQDSFDFATVLRVPEVESPGWSRTANHHPVQNGPLHRLGHRETAISGVERMAKDARQQTASMPPAVRFRQYLWE